LLSHNELQIKEFEDRRSQLILAHGVELGEKQTNIEVLAYLFSCNATPFS
jgi:hypothetical protein